MVGYVLSGVGIFIMMVGVGNITLGIGILKTIGETYIIGAGVLLVVVGVIISLKGNGKTSHGKTGQASSEVPIYEGEGKKRKIVGYQRN